MQPSKLQAFYYFTFYSLLVYVWNHKMSSVNQKAGLNYLF